MLLKNNTLQNLKYLRYQRLFGLFGMELLICVNTHPRFWICSSRPNYKAVKMYIWIWSYGVCLGDLWAGRIPDIRTVELWWCLQSQLDIRICLISFNLNNWVFVLFIEGVSLRVWCMRCNYISYCLTCESRIIYPRYAKWISSFFICKLALLF